MESQYLYRLDGADGELLYAGISDDWTRRLREHWRCKAWAPEILGVRLETYPDRLSVAAAERDAIHSERPLYNIQHNRRPEAEPEAQKGWAAEDVLILAVVVIAAGYLLYKVAEAGVTQYREWKADREDFREWKLAQGRDEQDAVSQERELQQPQADCPIPPFPSPLPAAGRAEAPVVVTGAPVPSFTAFSTGGSASPGWMAAGVLLLAMLGSKSDQPILPREVTKTGSDRDERP